MESSAFMVKITSHENKEANHVADYIHRCCKITIAENVPEIRVENLHIEF